MNQCINLTIGKQLEITASKFPTKEGGIFPSESLRITFNE